MKTIQLSEPDMLTIYLALVVHANNAADHWRSCARYGLETAKLARDVMEQAEQLRERWKYLMKQ